MTKVHRLHHVDMTRKVWIYQSFNQKPYIEERQAIQWQKKKDKQWST